MFARGQPPRGQQFIDLRLCGHGRVRPRANAMHEHAESPEALVHALNFGRRLFGRFLLTQASGCGVARIRKHLLPRLNLVGIELLKHVDAEEHFTAHFNDRRETGAGQSGGDARDKRNVFGDVFADHPVAAGGCRHQHAVFVAQVNGKAVNFQFAQVTNVATSIARDLVGPRREFRDREHVVETQHRLSVRDGAEQRGICLAADRLGWRIVTLQLGEHALKFAQAAKHPVVFCVVNENLIANLIGAAQLKNASRQGGYLVASLVKG